MADLDFLRDFCYQFFHRDNRGRNRPFWRGVQTIKFPTDFTLYAEVIFKNKPDFIIETGTKFGGSSLFFADMLSLFTENGRVISIDNNPKSTPDHPRVEYIRGSSSDRAIVEQVRQKVAGKKVMVVLDSDHRSFHVKRELRLFNDLVTEGQYLVVEDCYLGSKPYYPLKAVEWFLTKTNKFKLDNLEDRFAFVVTRGGWLRRV